MYIYIYQAHLAFVRFEHSVCRGSLITYHIYICIYIYIYKDSNHKELPCLVIPLDNHW